MNNFTLVRKNLTRNKLRLILNCFAIFIAFLLFGALGAIKNAFESGVEVAAADRLVTVNKINFTQSLPLSYVNKIRSVEGVKHVTWANWFGGYYQDPRDQVFTFAVDPETWFQVYDDLDISEEELSNWIKDRQGVLIGERIASARGWKVGDRIPLSSNIFSQADGSSTWEFNISGIFKPKNPQTDTTYTLIHYKYFMETQIWGGDWIGWLPIMTEDPALNDEVSKAIDDMFANSPAETETSTEAQFNKAFVEQMGDIGFIIMSVVLAAFFTILLIVGNSMWQSIRERTNEIAVLKTLGFTAERVFSMVLAESFLLAAVGGLLGLGVAAFCVSYVIGPVTQNFLPALVMGQKVFVTGLIFILALGFITGIVPAWQAMKLNTIDALNRR